MYYFLYITYFMFNFLLRSAKCQSHAFIQVDNELRYLVDGVAIPMQDIVDIGDSEHRHDAMYDEALLKNFLLFDPPFLDFREHPIGMPKMKKVFVHNTSPDTSINLHSLSGNTMHFHCTFFQDKVIAPGQNTSFEVVYLGREEGFIENTIYIHTSAGTYRYWVKAIGTANPYRIRPFIGLKMPLNSSYTPVIQLHNPHSHNLQIVEMYSTGGDLHLELPEGITEGEKQHWNIPAHHTKSIMRATFVARRENNHTAYIRIVPGDPVKDFMVIPVEVEVSSEQGLFFPADSLYFGVLTRHDPPVSLPLFLLNSAHKHIHIQNIITSAVNEAITIDFKPIKIPPGTVHPVQVATITFDPAKAIAGAKVSGKFIVKSKIAAYKLSIPFCVDMHQGELSYNTSATTFYSGENFDGSSIEDLEDERTHDLILKNTFELPVVVFDIALSKDGAPHFKVKWNGSVVIPANGQVSIANLTIASQKSDLRLTCNLTLHTNITSIKIPLLVYNGKLTKHIPMPLVEKWLDFGTLAMGEQRNVVFYVLNENPVPIRLKGWGCNEGHSVIELMGVHQGEIPLSLPQNKASHSKSIFLKPKHYAVFRIGVLSPSSEGVFVAEAFVQTQFETIKIPFRVRTAVGVLNITPNPFILDHSFPGKITSQELRVLSTFSHVMTVDTVKPLIPDKRFEYIASNQPVIRPNYESSIGRITFDPKIDCGEHCYTGFDINSKKGQQWVNAFNSGLSEVDTQLLSSMHDRYLKMGIRSFNTSLTLDTSEVQGHRFNTKVKMAWPRLIHEKKLKFPLTSLLNTSVKEFIVENPASQPVLAQLILLHQYGPFKSIRSSIRERFSLDFAWSEEESVVDNFVFVDSLEPVFCYKDNSSIDEYCFPKPEVDEAYASSLEEHRRLFELHTKNHVPKDNIVLFLKPLQKVKIRLAFTPTERTVHQTMLIVRNNLTVVEPVLIEAKGGLGHLNFDRGNYQLNYLQFHMQSNLMKNCSLITSSDTSVFSMLKSFVIRNIGDLPIDILRIRIGKTPCEEFGFQVTNCSGFRLLPNESRQIEVSFSPDFSLFYVKQTLTIETRLSYFLWHRLNDSEEAISQGHTLKVKLIATVASSIINSCGTMIPRPSWESNVYIIVVTILIGMLLLTLYQSYKEAQEILRGTFVSMTTIMTANAPQFDKGKVFDLQAIGAWTPSESAIDKPKAETNNNVTTKASKKIYDKKLLKIYTKGSNKTVEDDGQLRKKRQNNRYNNKNLAMSLSSFLSGGFGGKNEQEKSDACESLSRKDSFSNEEDTTEKDEVTSKRALSTSEASSTTESSSIEEIGPVKEDIYGTIEKVVRRKSKPLQRTFSDDCLLVKSGNNEEKTSTFEVTNKTKKAKKIKESKKNNLELPYTLKPTKSRETHDYSYKPTPRVRNKTHANLEKCNSGPPTSKHSVHNQMRPESQKVPVKAVVAPRIHNQPLAPRDPSYSAVVLGNTKPKAPVGKILPEVKQIERSSLGAIGQKPAHTMHHHNGQLSSYQPLGQDPSYNMFIRPHLAHQSHLNPPINSWGDENFSSHLQALQGLPRIPYEPISNNNMNGENSWMQFERPTQRFQWNENNGCQANENQINSQPQSLWESLSTFSIWSNPYDSNLLQGGRNYSNMPPSIWPDSQNSIPSARTNPNDQIRNRFDRYRRDGVN